MKVKIKGLVNRERFYAVIDRVAEYLEELGIEEIQGINFYLTPIHPETGEEALIVDSKTNEEIDIIVIDNPTKKAAKRKSNKIEIVNKDKS